MNSFGLSYAMAPVLGLLVHCRVPVRVVKDDTVGTCQVDSDATTSCRGDEAEYFWVQIELVHHLLASLYLDRAVKPDVCISMKVEEVLQDVEHASHLGEYEDLGALEVEGL